MALELILIGLKGGAAFYLAQRDASHSSNFKDTSEKGKDICFLQSYRLYVDFGPVGQGVLA